MSPTGDHDRAASARAGFRAALPYAAVGLVLSMSFGILARDSGFSAEATIVMSAIVFAGSAQFAAVSILASGGTATAAVAAAALMNSRFLPMGIALGPSLPGRAPWRAAQGQAVVDASWAMANRGDGTFDRWFLFGSTAPQYVTWIVGTVVGALGGDLFSDPSRFGLDAIYPTFFLALMLAEVKDRTTLAVAVVGGLVALSLVPVAPAGLPVLAASLVALWGLRRAGRAA
ncbi:AzlC family ABC transporter permease [Aeromicrobium sp. CFBP 8757]|uniref:AzlC family ABC transporter permease n=1 Tax=Aeromicrobium sp. CFBP 8757 TaxID=2775288 RepID=UPI001785FA17|nr:AzlC family ABC transporter permease [Aeromicrobium sp. CFBP 8757]MBD8605610.1 AzlC family ABC transporter permease [Aeromicrobium sp. CFBP 8757]